jgi:hypothetical protein
MCCELYTKLIGAFRDACIEWKIPEEFVFYLFPVRYKASGCDFECLCFLD